MTQAERHPPSRMLVTGTFIFYLFGAILMIIANKWILQSTAIPLCSLLVQLLIAVVLLFITHLLRFRRPPRLDLRASRDLLPLAIVNVLGMTFNTYALKQVDATFYQAARTLVLPMTVLLSYALLHTRPSPNVIIPCALLTFPFLSGGLLERVRSFFSTSTYSGAAGYSFLGVLLGFLSSLITALHAVLIKRSIGTVDGDVFELAWYTNVLSVFGLLPLVILFGEFPDFLQLLTTEASSTEAMTATTSLSGFLWGSIVTGVVGLLVFVSGLLSIKITSPITHMVTSAVRGVLVSLLGLLVLHNSLSFGRASSIALILVSSVYYTWVRSHDFDMHQKPASIDPLFVIGDEEVPMLHIEEVGEERSARDD